MVEQLEKKQPFYFCKEKQMCMLSTRRKRKISRYGDSLMESLSDNIGKFTEVCAVLVENMGQITKCFQFEIAYKMKQINKG